MTLAPHPQPTTGTAGASIAARLDLLAGISDESGALTRLYLSPAHKKAVALVDQWMHEAGMQSALDGAGSLIGRYDGLGTGESTLIIGSHIDTVRNAGRFDGNLGVLTGIEVVRALHQRGARLPFAIEVAAFGDEEGVRFSSTLGGSRALAGTFDAAALDERDADGVSRRAALAAFGCDPSTIPQAARPRGKTLGYVEVHIEQGPVLERRTSPVGIVTAINGAARGTVVLTGKASHAGTTPMAWRQDALTAAAEMILALEAEARGKTDLVATVGEIETPGGSVNTVPACARFSLDVRAPSDGQRNAALARVRARFSEIAAARRVSVEIDITYEAPAAVCDEFLAAGLARAVERCGMPVVSLPSGAGHDAMAFSGIMPFAMLFVRCRDGLSHHPEEYAAPADIDAGARVLADFIDHFDVTRTRT